MNSPLYKQLSHQLYLLKRRFPATVSIYQESGQVYDASTGKQTTVRARYIIRRAILLPSLLAASPRFALASTPNDRDFAYSGDIPLRDRPLLIDAKDLPQGFKLGLDDYIVVNHTRYDIKSIEQIDPGVGWSLMIRQVESATTFEIQDGELADSINLTEGYHVL